MNIKQEIKQIKQEFSQKLKELEKQYEQEEIVPDKYWFINAFGEKCDTFSSYSSIESYKQKKEIGNVFLTEEDCNYRIEDLKNIQRAREKV